MKQLFLLTVITFSVTLSAVSQIRFGIKAGYGLATASEKKYANIGSTQRKSNITGLHAGAVADIPLTKYFALQPGLFYYQKGVNFKRNSYSAALGQQFRVDSDEKLNYLELPVNFVGKLPLGTGKIFAGLGPYVAMGIHGKIKSDIYLSGSHLTDNREIKFGGKEQDMTDPHSDVPMKHFDAGASFTIGYEMKMGLVFSVGYSLGLTSISVETDGTLRNRYAGISIGYLFTK
ncbi:PorT family protein [Chitinophaga sp. Mgbs1]|uniref:PorT family protein n=1 Tax=Chitinophaga solisilvae TaxID=1233460 RepID=A0A3S1B2Y3_9BACT|nr:PorT family protein [Chitinophaga solisilvae]